MPTPKTETAKPARPASDRKPADRWTQNLVKRGWTPISDFFLDNYHRLTPPLKHSEAMFVVHLMRHKWDKAAPYPGFKAIARKMGISPEAARLHARSLDTKGYLFREMQIGQTNKFHLDNLFVALEKLMASDALENVQQHYKRNLATAQAIAQQQIPV